MNIFLKLSKLILFIKKYSYLLLLKLVKIALKNNTYTKVNV